MEAGYKAALRGQASELAPKVGNTSPALIAYLHFPNITGKGGRGSTVVDVSICHHSSGTSKDLHKVPLASSAAKEILKDDRYREAAKSSLFEVMPLVFETTGALGQSAKDFFMLLIANSCTPADEYNPSSDFEAIIRPVIVALHKSVADKYIAASQHHRGVAYRYNNTRFAALPPPHLRGRGRRGRWGE